MDFLKYFGFSEKNFTDCAKAIAQSNMTSTVFFSKIVAILLFGLAIASIPLPILLPFRWLYVATSALLAALYLLYRLLRERKTNSLLWAYGVMSILLGFGIALELIAPDFHAVAFLLMVVVLPHYFIDNFLRMSFYLITVVALYCVLILQVKTVPLVYISMARGVVFLALSLLLYRHFCTKAVGRMIMDRKREDMLNSYRQAQIELQSKAQKDPLTGLYNRNAFIELATIYLKKDRRRSSGVVLGILDIDHFKKINDTYGHQTGDHVLLDVAEILGRTLREYDIVGRLGGDEFIFMLVNVTDEPTAASIARRIIKDIEALGEAKNLPTRATVGLVIAQGRDLDFDELYQKADTAMYNAKNSGRNQYSFYNG